jgi:hypothetical protein
MGASFLLPLLSCEDNRLEGMVDDKLYLLKSGYQSTQVFNFGEYQIDAYIIKAGYGDRDAVLDIAVTPELLTAYNASNGTDYRVLPENCYSLLGATDISIPAKIPSEHFSILFNSTQIKTLLQDGKKYILPLSILAANGFPVDSVTGQVLVDPVIQEPYIAFSEPGLTSVIGITPGDPEEINMDTKVGTNYTNAWDLTFSVQISPDALTAYNQAAGTTYQILPANAVSLKEGPWAMPAGTSVLDVPYTIIRKNLVSEAGTYLFGEYVLPLKIASVSKWGIDPDNGVQFIRFNYSPELLSRTSWQVIDYNSCIMDEPQYSWLNPPRGPDMMLDGNKATYWGSKWDTPLVPLPYYFVIDMQTSKKVFRMALTEPADGWRGNIKSGYFEISDDQNTWTKLADFNLPNDGTTPNREHVIDAVPANGRYLKLVLTDAFGYDYGTDPSVGARMDLAELNVWGLDVE